MLQSCAPARYCTYISSPLVSGGPLKAGGECRGLAPSWHLGDFAHLHIGHSGKARTTDGSKARQHPSCCPWDATGRAGAWPGREAAPSSGPPGLPCFHLATFPCHNLHNSWPPSAILPSIVCASNKRNLERARDFLSSTFVSLCWTDWKENEAKGGWWGGRAGPTRFGERTTDLPLPGAKFSFLPLVSSKA